MLQVPVPLGAAPPKYLPPAAQYALTAVIPAPVADVPVTANVCRVVMLSRP